jgi:hypothetical protein
MTRDRGGTDSGEEAEETRGSGMVMAPAALKTELVGCDAETGGGIVLTAELVSFSSESGVLSPLSSSSPSTPSISCVTSTAALLPAATPPVYNVPAVVDGRLGRSQVAPPEGVQTFHFLPWLQNGMRPVLFTGSNHPAKATAPLPPARWHL